MKGGTMKRTPKTKLTLDKELLKRLDMTDLVTVVGGVSGNRCVPNDTEGDCTGSFRATCSGTMVICC
jgi:hypothetical protein